MHASMTSFTVALMRRAMALNRSNGSAEDHPMRVFSTTNSRFQGPAGSWRTNSSFAAAEATAAAAWHPPRFSRCCGLLCGGAAVEAVVAPLSSPWDLTFRLKSRRARATPSPRAWCTRIMTADAQPGSPLYASIMCICHRARPWSNPVCCSRLASACNSSLLLLSLSLWGVRWSSSVNAYFCGVRGGVCVRDVDCRRLLLDYLPSTPAPTWCHNTMCEGFVLK